jgi:hypothetical protein
MISSAPPMIQRSRAECRRPSGNETSMNPTPRMYVDSKSWPMVHGSGSCAAISSCTNHAKPVATITFPMTLSGCRSHATSPLATNDQPTSSEPAIAAPPSGSSAPAITAAAPMPAASAAGTRARRAGASVMG